jgi:hypothetical protein
VFGPDADGRDTVPPSITFLAPPAADSIYEPGAEIAIEIRAADRSLLAAVSASVSGILAFGYPPTFPNDTATVVGFRIATQPTMTGDLVFHVLATDTAENRSDTSRVFHIQ